MAREDAGCRGRRLGGQGIGSKSALCGRLSRWARLAAMEARVSPYGGRVPIDCAFPHASLFTAAFLTTVCILLVCPAALPLRMTMTILVMPLPTLYYALGGGSRPSVPVPCAGGLVPPLPPPPAHRTLCSSIAPSMCAARRGSS